MSDRVDPKSTGGLTRRDVLLAAAAGLMIGSGLLLVPKRYFRMPQLARTFVTKVPNYQLNIADAISRGIRELGISLDEVKGKRILLKPNLVETASGAPHINTHPLVLRGAIEAFLRLGASVVMVAEGPARIHDLLEYGVPFDRDLEGKLVLSREAAHSERRIVRVKGDMAGKAIMEALITKGFAYAAEGHVLFHVPAMPEYGQLSRRSLDDMIAGARVEVAPYKKHPADFVLWKPSTEDQPGWESPWGRGRPGWHIECSAMGLQHLGETFDIHAGGLDLKTPDGMLRMKDDMSGAAAVLAVMRALPELRPRVEVHGLIAAAENMPSGAALRPGDVLRALNGMTIEIGNTDAEGRLTLADALAYAAREIKPEEVVDIATLTGAIGVALGPLCAGLFATDDRLAGRLLRAGTAAGERLWRLPLIDEYMPPVTARAA